MKTIHKFSLNNTDLSLPKGAVFLSVQTQLGRPQTWWLVDVTPAQYEMHYLTIRGTGRVFTPNPNEKYLGTFQLEGGALVFHLFDDFAPSPE